MPTSDSPQDRGLDTNARRLERQRQVLLAGDYAIDLDSRLVLDPGYDGLAGFVQLGASVRVRRPHLLVAPYPARNQAVHCHRGTGLHLPDLDLDVVLGERPLDRRTRAAHLFVRNAALVFVPDHAPVGQVPRPLTAGQHRFRLGLGLQSLGNRRFDRYRAVAVLRLRRGIGPVPEPVIPRGRARRGRGLTGFDGRLPRAAVEGREIAVRYVRRLVSVRVARRRSRGRGDGHRLLRRDGFARLVHLPVMLVRNDCRVLVVLGVTLRYGGFLCGSRGVFVVGLVDPRHGGLLNGPPPRTRRRSSTSA